MYGINLIRIFIRRGFYTSTMANSRFEYVKEFETDDRLLPNCWIVVRIDGKGFHKFSNKHNFAKPNDIRALNLMNRAAVAVMKEFKEIVVSYGESDEYSFVIRKDTEMYNRRASKFNSYINSLFSASYVFFWKDYFKDDLKQIPSFDSRVILYPTDENLRDYLCWRQVDCHINNLYNTTFWALIQKGGLTNSEAEKELSGTVTADKNEILFSKFNINYNNEPVIFKKGTILLRKKIKNPNRNGKQQIVIIPLHEDMTNPNFFERHSEILSAENGKEYIWPEGIPVPDLVSSQLRINASNNEKLLNHSEGKM